MPTPFPGMDPYIESQEWSDFHPRFNVEITKLLTPQLGAKYIARMEQRIYLEQGLPSPVERREAYVVIRERQSREVVTVVEVLSPTNKIPGSDGRRIYLEKRDAILESRTHLVELDLLRGGSRLPLAGPVPDGDFYAMVSRDQRRPRVAVYAWTLRHTLPMIPIPLKPDNEEVHLDLQQAVNTVYDRARYDHSIDYEAHVEPPLSSEDAGRARDILKAARRA